MKELSIEEKAKRYDKAIEIAKEINNEHKAQPFDVMLKVFPELKESDDERIRKQLLKHLREAASGKSLELSTTDYERWATWLEKQGENNMGISEATKQELEDNLHRALEKETTESWKKFLEGEQKPVEKSDVYPPTLNEAIDLYYYSYGSGKGGFDKLSLEKFRDIVKTFVEDYSKQKPAWSEEDAKICGKCIDAASGYYSPEDKQIMKDWLRNLKDRFMSQPKQEWSEEDRRMLIGLIDELDAIMNKATPNEISVYSKYTNWLKSLRPQNTWKPSDEQMDMLAKVCSTLHLTTGENEIMESIYDALKKLK